MQYYCAVFRFTYCKENTTIMFPNLLARLLDRVNKNIFYVQKKTKRRIQSVRDVILSGVIIMLSGILIIWLSIFLYTAFYYAYVPNILFVRPVHLQFRSCDKEKGMCGNPSANVELTNKQQLLMVGQPYKISLHLEMPESPANKDLGMFMVCAKLLSRDDLMVDNKCRPTMLHYRSTLLHTLTTLIFSPMMIFGTAEEKQNVIVELFNNFEEDQNHPVTGIYIQILSQHIEFYSANIMINADLSGLRYLMYHWPILSAIAGIGSNLFFIALVCTLSYLHATIYEDTGDEDFIYEEGKKIENNQELKRSLNKAKEEDKSTNGQLTDSTSSEESFVLPYVVEPKEKPHSTHIEEIK